MDVGVLHSLTGECWLPVKGFPNYLISNRGRVYSLPRVRYDNPRYNKRGKLLIPRLGRQGYLYVCLCNKGKVTTKKIHRLVAETFVPNPENLDCVNHKDEIKTNNFVENLEWCTNAYNLRYGDRLSKTVETFIENGITTPIVQLTKSGEPVREFVSMSEAARVMGVSSASSIHGCCNGSRKTAYGFIWKYKDAV